MTADVLLDRITADPKVLAGKPVVRGTRVSVDLVIDLLARGYSKGANATAYCAGKLS